MGFTENQSPTSLTSGNPCVDLFFHIVPNTRSYSLVQHLEAAWKHNDWTTLKLICHVRGVRSIGKSDKEGFYAAALWLHKHHPRTLACNMKSIAEFGYSKDLPELLYRILEGPELRRAAREESQRGKKLRRMPKDHEDVHCNNQS
ncbi:hypothetical protein IFM89_015029 [Coptis chinensis]|uniref:DUF2828 domain-containing protein n=1 Tax=Coptis chinensis TaxID=261450 RepID=A0A835LRR0_9MAGN|nr:hypothetical protein IFM89_015029 [Coptis chinensis]